MKRIFLNMSIILAHASREEKDKEQKNVFYDHLKAICAGCSEPLQIVTGDFNVQVVKEHVFPTNVMKKRPNGDTMTTQILQWPGSKQSVAHCLNTETFKTILPTNAPFIKT